jgi:hypothetical protein
VAADSGTVDPAAGGEGNGGELLGLSLLSWKRVGLSNYVAEAKAR